MQVRRTLTALLLVGVLVLTTGAVALADQSGGTITLSYKGNEVPDPDPHLASNIGAQSIALMIADPLVRWVDGDIEPLLAESWTVSEDGLVFTLKLRAGVEFHNGVALTAAAVKANIDRVKDPDNAMPGAGNVANVDTVEAVDDLTLVITLSALDPDFLAKLEGIYIIEPTSLEGRDNNDPVAGSGAFRLDGDAYVRDQSLKLVRFDGYWAGAAKLEEIIVRLIPDEATALIELEQGTVDLVQFGLSKDVARLEAEGYNVFPFGFVNWANVAVNLERITDVTLRKALAYALDSQAIIDGVYSGLGEVQTSLGYPGSWLANPDVGYAYDPAEAERILDEAGYVDSDGNGVREIGGVDIDLHFPTRNQDEWMRATQFIQQMFADVGIGTHITIAERMPFYDGVRSGDYDIAWWLQNSSPTPPIGLYSWDSREYWSIHQKEQPAFQALIEAAEREPDQEKRAALYREIQEIFADEALAPLGIWLKQVHFASASLNGIQVSPTGTVFDSHLWWKE